eukprot:6691569-Pyramimonas_sp.AAC.1
MLCVSFASRNNIAARMDAQSYPLQAFSCLSDSVLTDKPLPRGSVHVLRRAGQDQIIYVSASGISESLRKTKSVIYFPNVSYN